VHDTLCIYLLILCTWKVAEHPCLDAVLQSLLLTAPAIPGLQ
jgi:hypothetical protein